GTASVPGGVGLLSSALVLTGVPRAVRRAASLDPELPLDLLAGRAAAVIDAVALHLLDRALLGTAGSSARSGRRRSGAGAFASGARADHGDALPLQRPVRARPRARRLPPATQSRPAPAGDRRVVASMSRCRARLHAQ